MMTNKNIFVSRHGSHGKNWKSGVSCCSCRRHGQKISPEDGTIPGYDTVRISEDRIIRVQHVNPQLRDSEFESQMQAFIKHEYGELQSIHSQQHPDHCSYVSSPNNSLSHVGNSTLKRTKSAGPMRSRLSLQTQHISSPKQSPSKSLNETTCANNNRSRTATSVVVDVDKKFESPVHHPGLSSTFEDDIEEIPFVTGPPVKSVSKDADPIVKNLTIFMFHGVGGTSDIWQAQIDYLKQQHYELIVPDFLGHGFSSAPREAKAYLFSQLARDILFIFDKYCNKYNVIIGHSYGSSFACHVAKERAQYVTYLMTISGGSPTPLAPQPGLFQWPVCFLECCKPTLKKFFKKSAFHVKRTYVPREKAFDIPAYVLKYTMNGQDWSEGTFHYHSLITANTIVLHGQYDGLISLEEEEEMVQAIAGSELKLVEDSSHMVMIEQPERVNSLIQELLNRGIHLQR